MKNLFAKLMAVALVALLSFSTVSFAGDLKSGGDGNQFGVTAGLNLANVSGDNSSDNSMKIGAHFGVMYRLAVSDNFSIVPGVIYTMKGTQSKASSSNKINLNYLEIPVLAAYSWENGFRVFAGPYIGFLMSATADPGSVDIKSDVQSSDFGLKLGVGYKLGMGLGFNVHYELGLSNIDKNAANVSPAPSNKTSNIGIGVSYWFASK